MFSFSPPETSFNCAGFFEFAIRTYAAPTVYEPFPPKSAIAAISPFVVDSLHVKGVRRVVVKSIHLS
jgi:hypothetical protein